MQRSTTHFRAKFPHMPRIEKPRGTSLSFGCPHEQQRWPIQSPFHFHLWAAWINALIPFLWPLPLTHHIKAGALVPFVSQPPVLQHTCLFIFGRAPCFLFHFRGLLFVSPAPVNPGRDQSFNIKPSEISQRLFELSPLHRVIFLVLHLHFSHDNKSVTTTTTTNTRLAYL